MNDYVYPSVYFVYFTFFLLFGGALVFFARSLKDGYFGHDSESVKYRMLEDDHDAHGEGKERGGAHDGTK